LIGSAVVWMFGVKTIISASNKRYGRIQSNNWSNPNNGILKPMLLADPASISECHPPQAQLPTLCSTHSMRLTVHQFRFEWAAGCRWGWEWDEPWGLSASILGQPLGHCSNFDISKNPSSISPSSFSTHRICALQKHVLFYECNRIRLLLLVKMKLT